MLSKESASNNDFVYLKLVLRPKMKFQTQEAMVMSNLLLFIL
jgi:hypothetical protein